MERTGAFAGIRQFTTGRTGIAGAQKTGVALQQVEFTAAYSSILQRAIDTAGHIIGQRPIPLF